MKVGDKVRFGFFQGIIVKIYVFNGEEWAKVEIDGEISDIKISNLIALDEKSEEKI